jgi:hypothetical protein
VSTVLFSAVFALFTEKAFPFCFQTLLESGSIHKLIKIRFLFTSGLNGQKFIEMVFTSEIFLPLISHAHHQAVLIDGFATLTSSFHTRNEEFGTHSTFVIMVASPCFSFVDNEVISHTN